MESLLLVFSLLNAQAPDRVREAIPFATAELCREEEKRLNESGAVIAKCTQR